MASRFTGATFDGIAEESQMGYSAGLSVALAYSALESFEKATVDDANMRRMSIADDNLSANLRSHRCARFINTLREESTSKHLQHRIETWFRDEDNGDVRPVVEATRHLVFHGVFTPYGSGATGSKFVREIFKGMKESTLSTASQAFIEWTRMHPTSPAMKGSEGNG